MQNTATTSIVVMIKNLAYIPAFIIGLDVRSYGILAVLMVLDTITGIIRAGVVHGWRSVNSHQASFGILSKLVMILVPIVLALAGEGVKINIIWVAQGALSMLILSETYSILGNIQSVRLRRDVVEFDAINFILQKIRLWLEYLIKK